MTLFVELVWTPRAAGVTVNFDFLGWLSHIIITCCTLLLRSPKVLEIRAVAASLL